MTAYTVHLVTGASTAVDVDIDGEFDPEAIVAAAHDQVYINLCHECVHKVTLGDFDESEITDAEGQSVWTAPDPATQQFVAQLEKLLSTVDVVPDPAGDSWLRAETAGRREVARKIQTLIADLKGES